jgi:hypothetical protein
LATTNHARLNNLAPTSTTSTTNWIWALTRALKKAGWKFKASSNGTTKISNGDPAADNWGSGVTSNAGASAASIAAPTQGRATVTGLTGIVAADKGRFLLVSGAATGANNNQHQIEEVLSSTSVRIDARQFAVASDANNGSLVWSIRDPLTETYPALETNAAWWCAQGPSILRIPFTSASSGTFVRGENIVQSSTGAEGELLGYTFSDGTGYLNVAPRVRGSGGGVYGWATGNLVTGGSSAATLTQNGTALEYVYEVVFAKPAGATTLVQMLVGQFETVAESAELFSFCATQTGATAAVHPGGGGTNNTFGAHAWTGFGTNTTPGAGVSITSSLIAVRGNVICVDAIPEANYSADGSFSLLYTWITSGNPEGFSVLGLHRLNDIEDADFAPYVSINYGGTKTLYGQSRTSAGTAAGITVSQGFPLLSGNITRTAFNGWRRRGLTSESFAEFEAAILNVQQTAGLLAAVNAINIMRIATSPDTTTRIREPIWIVSVTLGAKVLKGTLKWFYIFPGEQATDIFGADPAWVQICGPNVTGVVTGPQDGTPWVLN